MVKERSEECGGIITENRGGGQGWWVRKARKEKASAREKTTKAFHATEGTVEKVSMV